MTFDGTNNGEAAQALQEKVLAQKDKGYAVISPGGSLSSGAYAVTVNSGDINTTDTLSVGTSGDEALFNGSTVTLSSATNLTVGGVNTDVQGNEQYRYDVIWIDSSGEVNKTTGNVGTLADAESNNNLTRFERFSNPIPTPDTYPSTVVAVVVVNSGDSSVTTDNLRDYRVPADVSTNTLSGALTGGSTLSDIAGSALTIASNSLDVAVGNGLTIASDALELVDDISVSSIANSDYSEAVNTITDASGTTNIDLSTANMHEVECDADVTITFSNFTSAPEGNSLLIRFFDDDGTGPHTISWPASVEFSDGDLEDTLDSNGELEIALRSYDGGTTVKASRSGVNFA